MSVSAFCYHELIDNVIDLLLSILDGIFRIANLSHPVNVSKSSEFINVTTEGVALDHDFIIDINLPRRSLSMLVAVEQYNSTKYAALTALIPSDSVKFNYMTPEFIFIGMFMRNFLLEKNETASDKNELNPRTNIPDIE